MPAFLTRTSRRLLLLALAPICAGLALTDYDPATAQSVVVKTVVHHGVQNSQEMTRPLADTSPAPKAQPIALAPSHIVHRQNLKPVGYAPLDGGPASVPGAREDSAESSVEALTGKAVLRSEVAYVQDIGSDAILYDKNGDEVRPIASISKLMTALVVTDARQPMDEIIQVTDADVDRLRYSRSRLRVGTELSRADLLHLALMSSENRAAHALGRNYPGGLPAFVRAMNDKARALGMRNTHFVEPTGLSSENVSSPRDLVKLLQAVSKQPIIHRYTTDDHYEVTIAGGRRIAYNNTNRLVRNDNWNIKISKTGFINEAGECLVMLTRIEGRDLAIVLLNSSGRYSRIGDAVRLRKVVENASSIAML